MSPHHSNVFGISSLDSTSSRTSIFILHRAVSLLYLLIVTLIVKPPLVGLVLVSPVYALEPILF